jgi:hypothetical protein
VIDCGTKVLTSDLYTVTGYGHVMEYPDAVIRRPARGRRRDRVAGGGPRRRAVVAYTFETFTAASCSMIVITTLVSMSPRPAASAAC